MDRHTSFDIRPLGLIFALSFVACGGDDPTDNPTAMVELDASEIISNPAPDLAGTGSLTTDGDEVTLTLTLLDCPEGEHGFHIHAGTECGSDGSLAMSHWDPLGADAHGQVGEAESHHAGDVGVVSCDADGNGTLTISTNEWSLDDGVEINPVGQAVILHGVDASQRIGCGVIEADGSFAVDAMTLTVNPAADISGAAELSENAAGEVTLDVELSGCPEGDHGFHIHAGTSCGPEGKEAMSHWDPLEVGVHGQVGESAPHHAGDVGVVSCDAEGNGTLSLTTDEWTLSDSASSLNPTGQAVIVHGIDPANRIACGVIAN